MAGSNVEICVVTNNAYEYPKMESDDAYKLQHVFTWKIENFSMCTCGKNEELHSPFFKAENISNEANWFIGFYPLGYENNFAGHSSCFLVRYDGEPNFSEIECSYSMEVVSSTGEAIRSVESTSVFRNGSSFGFKNFLDMNRLKQCPEWLPGDTLTLRCHMKDKPTTQPKVSKNFAVTKLGYDRVNFLWKVHNVLELSEPSVLFFRLGDVSKYALSFQMIEDLYLIIMEQSNTNLPVTKAVFEMTIVNSIGDLSKLIRHEYIFKFGQHCWPIPFFLTKSDLLKYRTCEILGDLTLKCVLSVSNDTHSASLAEHLYFLKPCEDDPPSVDAGESLLADMKNLYFNRMFSDVILRFGEHQVECHKAILAAQSDWFAEQLKHSELNELNLSPMEPKLLNMFLEYLYTGEVTDIDQNSAHHLTKIAKIFKMKQFHDYCCRIYHDRIY